MAEAVVFSLASKILSAAASPAFKMVYEKGVSISEARDDLAKLQVSVETIQSVLLDAEKKQEGSVAVKNWIKRVKGVLYDAEDLFDEVATENLVKQQLMAGEEKLSLMGKVLVSCSKLNPIASRNSIAKKVKYIRMSLDDISRDMAQFEFVRCQDEKLMFNVGRGEDRGNFVDVKSVIGRDKDREIVLKMLISEPDSSKSNKHVVLAIVGIGGMGKTTLAQLIYNDDEIGNKFQNRWFACISNISDERELLGKIFQSITGESCSELDVGQLHTKIRESIKDKNYLLVLDDVWEDDRARWIDRMSLLNSCASESKIIVTTRLPSVAKAVGALRPHKLEGLSSDDSWSLFKKLAFVEEYENDPRRKSLGEQIVEKCSGVPLAIQSIGSLLYLKNTIEEWEAIARDDLPVIGRKYNDKTMSVLKLSYDHLPSYLKHCFAYCCLFPKDYVFSKRDLINHWAAQGYIDPNDEESGFMHLLRRGFFQEAEEGERVEIKSYKMHDLMHDLAIYVAGDESVVFNSTSSNTSSCLRHVSLRISKGDESLDISTLMLNAKSLRSLLLITHSMCAIESSKLGKLFASVKLLRTLSLSMLGIENVPPSIGELKLMKHLDLSHNQFEKLPDSVANLINLLSLNLERCNNFSEWPPNFHKLINLRYLNFEGCLNLWLMPTWIGKMTHLRYLSNFETEKGNKFLNMSARLLQQLQGKLSIRVWGDVDGDDCKWQLPVSLHELEILGYKGRRMPGWGDYGRANKLARLKLSGCTNVKHLPSLRCLPNLRWLVLKDLMALEFMEEEEDGTKLSKFSPCLEELHLQGLMSLTRWQRKIAVGVTLGEFPRLRELSVIDSPYIEFDSFPLCTNLKVLKLNNQCKDFPLTHTKKCNAFPHSFSGCASSSKESTSTRFTKWLHGLGSIQHLEISYCDALKSLQMASPHLEKMSIYMCHYLLSIELVGPQNLQDIVISYCKELKSIELIEVQTPHGRLDINCCRELESLRASARLIAALELLKTTGCNKLRLDPLVLPSPTALDLGGCSWSFEAFGVDDCERMDKLSWLPIQDVYMVSCTLPIRFPAAPFTSLRSLIIHDVQNLEVLLLDGSPLLQELYIRNCRSLISVEVAAPMHVEISFCFILKNLRIADPNALEEFLIEGCPEVEDFYRRYPQPSRECPHFPYFQEPCVAVLRRSTFTAKDVNSLE